MFLVKLAKVMFIVFLILTFFVCCVFHSVVWRKSKKRYFFQSVVGCYGEGAPRVPRAMYVIKNILPSSPAKTKIFDALCCCCCRQRNAGKYIFSSVPSSPSSTSFHAVSSQSTRPYFEVERRESFESFAEKCSKHKLKHQCVYLSILHYNFKHVCVSVYPKICCHVQLLQSCLSLYLFLRKT